MNDWNPSLYLKFSTERMQPALDLIARIQQGHLGSIIDIGCGAGNSTQVLAERWPQAVILGVDSSPAMIEKAKTDYPHQQWRRCDVGKETIKGRYDLVFSNATIHWIPNHQALLGSFYQLLQPGGVLAVQMPLVREMPLGKSIVKIASDSPWRDTLREAQNAVTVHDYSFYYECLSSWFADVEMWVTEYIHLMDSHEAILEMMRSTRLRPYLSALSDVSDKVEFERLVLEALREECPLQKNGRVCFPFRRLFFIAKKA